jgi:hypothetical protein
MTKQRKDGFYIALGNSQVVRLTEHGTFEEVKPTPRISNFALFAPVTFPPFEINTADAGLEEVLCVGHWPLRGSREQLQPKRAEAGNAVDGVE